MKLAMIALLVHPIMILMPTGLFSATDWGTKAVSNPGPHGFSQIMYQFSSASANNGSAFDGLAVTYGLNNNPNPSPPDVSFVIGTALILISRFYDHCADRHGSESLFKEVLSVQPRHFAGRHFDLRFAALWNDSHYRRPALSTRSRAWAPRGTFRSDSIWWLNRQ
jgi:hypothetical protein